MLNLEVLIGGDSKKLRSELRKAAKDLERFEDQAEDAVSPLADGKTLGRASKGVDNLNKSTANAVPTLTEFSRVIQDAPFGIQGVANNVTQLTSLFGSLAKSTGGPIQALKAVGGAILGPAGVLLAVSTITSVLVEYGDELLDTTKLTEELSKATKGFLGDAKQEEATLKSLLSVARDENQ